MSRYEVAVELVAEYGIAVFPCNQDKTPRTKSGFKDATTSLERVDDWFLDSDALIGVPSGVRFFVVDVDPAGADWYTANQGRLNCGCINRTRRGWHLVYAMPEGVEIPCSAGKLAPGVDVRGTGGYVIWWPGEDLPTTGTLNDIGPPPAWLLGQLAANPQSNVQDHGSGNRDAGQTFHDGGRNVGLTSLAGKLRHTGLGADGLAAALLVHNANHCVPPIPDSEVRGIAASVGRYPPGAADEPTVQPVTRLPIDWSLLLDRNPPMRSWRIEGWLTGGATLFAGKAGIGKTHVAQQLGTALSQGRAFLDDVHEPQTVLMWACEDDHNELWRRQLSICGWLGVSLNELMGRLIIIPRLGIDNALFATNFGKPTWTRLREELRQQVNDYHADVLILDNIGQVFGGSENDRHHVTVFVNGLCGLRGDPEFSPIIVGHPAKGIGSEFSGSTAWENAVRMRWYLGTKLPDLKDDDTSVETNDDVRYLAKRKANYTSKDWRRLTYTNGIFLPEAQEAGVRFDSVARKEITEAVTLKGLKRLVEMNMNPGEGVNSPRYLPRQIMEMKLNEGHSKAELADAMRGLLLANRIVITDATGADRHKISVLRLAPVQCGK